MALILIDHWADVTNIIQRSRQGRTYAEDNSAGIAQAKMAIDSMQHYDSPMLSASSSTGKKDLDRAFFYVRVMGCDAGV